ncbi:MAG: alanine racemase [Candidatus Eremiobacteraeota bacterium]|nr:alanine racemase [Candidatus Eremiobacteraeota bacterium]MBC5828351.1 alanine racemase [Candidatus Eremiobacteraeota bacterium]
MRRPSYTLNLSALSDNVRAWRSLLGDVELWAVVKSNAYGQGLLPVAEACLKAGARRLCVIDIGEARALRAAGVDAPLVHICATAPDELADAVALGVVVTIDDEHSAAQLSRCAEAAGVTARAHVAFDTGTGWSGVTPQDTRRFARAVRDYRNIEWEGAWTHIAGQASQAEQLRAFGSAVEAVRQAALGVPLLHVASTGPVLWGARAGQGAARIGVGLYGPAMGQRNEMPPLKTAPQLRAFVVYVKRFAEPTALGYGGKDTVPAGAVVATLRLGYGDGLPKSLASGGSVCLKGRDCRIVGEIGMNFTMILLPEGYAAAAGDEALVLGDLPGHSLDEVAEAAGVIPHALLTSLGNGMPKL